MLHISFSGIDSINQAISYLYFGLVALEGSTFYRILCYWHLPLPSTLSLPCPFYIFYFKYIDFPILFFPRRCSYLMIYFQSISLPLVDLVFWHVFFLKIKHTFQWTVESVNEVTELQNSNFNTLILVFVHNKQLRDWKTVRIIICSVSLTK